MVTIILLILGVIALAMYIPEKIRRYTVKATIMKSIVSVLFIAVAISAGSLAPLAQFIIMGLVFGLIVDELLACLPENHPMAKKKTFPVKAFAKEDFIELYPGKETDNSKMLQQNGITPKVKYSTSDNYAAYAMVAAGLGITCTNAIIGEAFKDGVCYRPLSPKQPVEIGIALPEKKEMSPAAKRFAEFARERFE